MGLTFFTLPNNYSTQLHNQIWELCQFGNGFNWWEVYHMPIHWRKFYYQKLVELKQKEKGEIEKAKSSKPNSKVRVKR